MIQLSFELTRGRKFQGEQIKTMEGLRLGIIGLIVAPWKFDVLKTSIFALEASFLGQIFVLRTSNFCGAAISRWFLVRNTLLFRCTLLFLLFTTRFLRRTSSKIDLIIFTFFEMKGVKVKYYYL